MTASDVRKTRYTSIVEGETVPVAVLAAARGPKTLALHELEARERAARERFERAAGASRSYKEQQIASSLALARAKTGGFRT